MAEGTCVGPAGAVVCGNRVGVQWESLQQILLQVEMLQQKVVYKPCVVVSARQQVPQMTLQVGLHPISLADKVAYSPWAALMVAVSSSVAAAAVYFLNMMFTS